MRHKSEFLNVGWRSSGHNISCLILNNSFRLTRKYSNQFDKKKIQNGSQFLLTSAIFLSRLEENPENNVLSHNGHNFLFN